MKKYTGNIESMPMGATLTGIVVKPKHVNARIGNIYSQSDFMELYSPAVIERPYRLKPNYIEVHDDVIVLMFRKKFGELKGMPPCEVNIKIGTLVEWEI